MTTFFFSLFLFSGPNLPDNDLYYHTAIAKKYLNLNFTQELPWPELSIQSKTFTDFHFLFHLLEMPFLLLPFSEITNIKFFILFCLCFSFFQLIKYLESINPKLDYLFVSLFFALGSPLFTGRMLFGRGIILFIGFYFLFLRSFNEKKHFPTFIISFFSVWCYAGFPLLILTAVLFAFSAYFQKRELPINVLFLTILGVTCGLIIHPSFPHQFMGYYVEIILQAVEPMHIEPIAEWMAPDRNLVFGGVWFILPWIILKFLLNKEWKPEHFIFLSLTFLYLIFSSASLRLFEMFWLFAFLFLFVSTEEPKIFKYLSIVILIFILFPNIYFKMQNQFKHADPTSAIDTTNWINQNLKKEEKIFLSWGDFPIFVYKSPEMRYLYGLNPLYAWAFDSNKYALQRSFFEGSTENFQYIPNLLGYKYVILNQFYNQPVFHFLKTFAGMELIYENKNYCIFRVKDSVK